jgi:hypothetical protein
MEQMIEYNVAATPYWNNVVIVAIDHLSINTPFLGLLPYTCPCSFKGI